MLGVFVRPFGLLDRGGDACLVDICRSGLRLTRGGGVRFAERVGAHHSTRSCALCSGSAPVFVSLPIAKFSTRLGPEGERALGEIASRFDAIGAMLGGEQGDNDQRELLLKTIVGGAPMAIVLYGDSGRIAYSNMAARELFFEGNPLEGNNFLHMLKDAPEPMRAALLAENAALFTLEQAEDSETYHLGEELLPDRR